MGANKKTLGTSTEFTAVRTSLGCKVGINFNYINPSLISFILNKSLELVKTPSIEPEVKPFSFLGLADSFDVFEYNCSSITIADDLFAYNMIPVSLETSFSARNLFQEFPCRVSAFALEPCSQSFEFNPVFSYMFSTEKPFIACNSDMVYSDINTKRSTVKRTRDVDISGKSDMHKHPVKLISFNDCSLPRPVKVFPVIFWNLYRYLKSSPDCGNTGFIEAECKISLVKTERKIFPEHWLGAFIGFNGFKGLRCYSVGINHQLRWKVKQFSAFIVAKMMKLVSVMNLIFKTFISYVRNSLRILLHCIKDKLIWLDSQFHGYSRPHISQEDIIIYNSFVSPLTAKAVSIRNGVIL